MSLICRSDFKHLKVDSTSRIVL